MTGIYTIIIGFTFFLLSESKALVQQSHTTTTVRTVSSTAGHSDYIAANGNAGTVNTAMPLTISVVTGTDANGIELSYSGYPNPSSDFVKLTVQPGGYDNMRMRLFTVKGQVILDRKLTFGQCNIYLPDYSSSIYMFKIFNGDNEVKSFKINKLPRSRADEVLI